MRMPALLAASMAFLAIGAAAQEKPGDNNFDMDQVLEEIQHQSDLLRDWVTDRVSEVKREHFNGPAEPIGRNVTLTFTLGGADQALTLATAHREYRAQGHWSSSQSNSELQQHTQPEEYALEIEGTVESQDDGQHFLVLCNGVIEMHSHEEGPGGPGPHEEFVLEFLTSVEIVPGDTKTLVKRGNQQFTLTLEME